MQVLIYRQKSLNDKHVGVTFNLCMEQFLKDDGLKMGEKLLFR